MTLRKSLLTVGLGLALAAPLAQAHEFWLLPSSTVLSSPGYITVNGAVSNDIFYFNYRPLGIRDNLVISAPDGSTLEAENMVQGKLRTVFDANLQANGTYRLAIANASLMASWKEGGETKRWRGNRDEMAANVPAAADELVVRESVSRLETFVTVGRPSELQAVTEGMALEAITHPNDLYEGSQASFRFVVNGKPTADIKVELIRAGTRYRDQLEKITLTTDSKGEIHHTWSHPGMYYLKAQAAGAAEQGSNIERRLSYVATLEVLAQ